MASTGAAKSGMAFKKRLVIALAIVVLTVAPALVMIAVIWVAEGSVEAAATWASLPAIAGIAAVAVGGQGFAIRAAIVMAFLAPLTIVAGSSPVSGAAVMALLCLVVGRLARVGLHKSALLVPVMMAWPLIDPPTWGGASTVDRLDTPYLLWMTVVFLVGGLLPALVGPLLLRERSFPPPTPHSLGEALPYTVMITTLVTVATYYVLDTPEMYGGAFLIVAKVESLALVYVIGLVLIVIALVARFGRHGWIYYVFMMPATACLNATTLEQVGQLGKQRAIDNLVGGVAVLIASALVIGYSSWASKHGHASDEDVEAAAVAAAAVK